MGERAKMTNLVRYVAFAAAVPTISIGGILFLADPQVHALHMVAFLVLGGLAIAAFVAAPRLAAKMVPTDSA
jgi:hypothetical protein